MELEIIRLREGWTHCMELCQQYEKRIAELESNLEAMHTNQCSMCTLWQKMKAEEKK